MDRDLLAELFRDIRADPDDDLPRLVLGDWLLDHGDPRGEFVQIDLRLARLEDGPERDALERRRRELLRDHAIGWLGPILDVARGWEWTRGLLHLDARASVLLRESSRPAIASEAFGWVQSVALEHCVPHLGQLEPSGLLGRLSHLRLACSRQAGWIAELLRIEPLVRLRSLALEFHGGLPAPALVAALRARFGDRLIL